MCCHIARGLTMYSFLFTSPSGTKLSIKEDSRTVHLPIRNLFYAEEHTVVWFLCARVERERKKSAICSVQTRYCLCIPQYNCLFSSSISCNSPKRLTTVSTKEAAVKFTPQSGNSTQKMQRNYRSFFMLFAFSISCAPFSQNDSQHETCRFVPLNNIRNASEWTDWDRNYNIRKMDTHSVMLGILMRMRVPSLTVSKQRPK